MNLSSAKGAVVNADFINQAGPILAGIGIAADGQGIARSGDSAGLRPAGDQKTVTKNRKVAPS